jgi:hypothetical protein
MKKVKLSTDPRLINIDELDLDKEIFRIISLNRLVEMLREKELVLPKVNLWEDVYENFFLKSNLLIDGDEIIGLKEDSDQYFGQCWGFIEDSDAMWRIYSCDKLSIRIKTTIRKLINALNPLHIMGSNIGILENPWIGAVEYKSKEELNVWMKKQIIKRDNLMPNIKDSLFIKRDSFQHESEVRVVYYAEDESDSKIKPDSNSQLVSFQISPLDLIDEIAFDPRADDSYYRANKEFLTKELKVPAKKITKSKLYDFDPFTFIVT